MSRAPSSSRYRRRDDEDFGDDDDDGFGGRRPRRRGDEDWEPHRGGTVLAYGIIGLLACQIFGVMAWIMGSQDLKAMREGLMDPEGESQTRTGMCLGMLCVAINLIGLVLIIVFVAFLAMAANEFRP